MSVFDPIADVEQRCHRWAMRRTFLVFAVLCEMVSPSNLGAATRTRCADLKKAHATATVSGLLTVQLFAGPPNYESIAKGDAEEKALILELPRRMCADDGEFIVSSAAFDRVQVSSEFPAVLSALSAAVGRRVTVKGKAFGAHTAHHHAPLVLFADQVVVR